MKLKLTPLEDRTAPAILSGRVFADYNGNQTRDAIDRGLSGVVVRLDLMSTGNFDFSTTTKSDGSWSFSNVPNGTHLFSVVTPTNYTATKPVSGVTVSGPDINNIEMGFRPNGTITGVAYHDTDFDGSKDAGDESGLGGVTFTLDLFGDGKSIQTVVSAGDGIASFSGVPNGTHVLTSTRTGFDHVSINPVSVNVINGGTVSVPMGFLEASVVSGFVYSDVNLNSILDAGEFVLPNYEVRLEVTGGTPRVAMTNANGQFFFADVPDGKHTLKVTATNQTKTVTVAGASVGNFAFAVAPSGKLQGVVFNDLNANGVQDTGEAGLGGVAVDVDFYGNGTVDRTITTAADGSYSFTNIPDGSHSAKVSKTGYITTNYSSVAFTMTQGTIQPPPTPVLVGGPRTPGDAVFPGVAVPTTFALAAENIIRGTIYVDSDKDGTADAGEPELQSVVVKLDNGITTVTDKYGRYAFTGVTAGSHTVSFTVPGGYTSTGTTSRTLTVAAGINTVPLMSVNPGEPQRVLALSTGNTIAVLNSNGTVKSTFNAFASGTDSRIATGDVNGDGIDDYAIATGAGPITRVRIVNGNGGSELFAINPYGSDFTGGAFVSLGDLNGDGRADLVITPDITGGPRVRVFSGSGFNQLADFFGIDDVDFRGGARTAVGDLNNDGRGDLAVSAGFGGGPRIALFDGMNLQLNGGPKFVGDFFAFETDLRNGAFITIGDIDGDGYGDLVCGAGSGGAPRVTAFSGKDIINDTQTRLADFFAGNQVGDRSGARVAVSDVDGDGKMDIAVSYRKVPQYQSRVAVYQGGSNVVIYDVEPFPGTIGMVYVG